MRIENYIYGAIVLLSCINTIRAAYTYDLEADLRTGLFGSYNLFTRPTENVEVNVTFSLFSVNSLIIKDQSISVAGFFTLEWSDARFDWSTNTTYSTDIPSIYSNEDYVWRPAVIVENSISDISVINADEIPMRIDKYGRVVWNPTGIFTTHCESDVTYYPFDSQTCEIHLSSWAYTNVEITLSFDDSPIDMTYYKENGEWDFVEFSTASKTDTRGENSFSNLYFYLKFRRKPLFQFSNSLIPMTLLSILNCMVFKIPVESGEKMGYTLTVLLSYAVYLTIVSADIPTTSLHVSLLSVYLIFNLCLGIIAVIMTIFILDCHHQDPEKSVPGWLRKLTLNFMVPMFCLNGKRSGCCKKDTKIHSIVTEENKNELPQKSKPDNTVDEDPVTWPEVTKTIDSFFLRLFFILVTVITVLFYGIMLFGYLSQ